MTSYGSTVPNSGSVMIQTTTNETTSTAVSSQSSSSSVNLSSSSASANQTFVAEGCVDELTGGMRIVYAAVAVLFVAGGFMAGL